MDGRASKIQRAFSLIEVVVATAIVAVGVTTVLALLAALLKTPSHGSDSAGAIALASSLQNYLQRNVDVNGLDQWVTDIPIASLNAPGFCLVASRDRNQLRLLSVAETEVPSRDQFYLIELRRFPGPGPLAYETGANHLAVNVVITWPYRVLTPERLAEPTSPETRDAITFNLGVTR